MTIFKLPVFDELEGYERDPFRSFYNCGIYQEPYDYPLVDFPGLLDIEVNNHCNFDCLFCYRNKMIRKENFMDTALFRKIIDESRSNNLTGIRICGWGEPFMHRNIYDMIQYASSNTLLVHITTNGSFLINDDNRKRLLDSGCNKVKFSFQGADENGYGVMRNNSLYQNIVKAVLSLINERDRAGSNLFVQVGTSFTDETMDERASFFDFWVDKADHVYGDNTHLEHVKDMERIKNLTMKSEPVYRQNKFSRCGRPQSMMFISSSGQASFCCSDYNMENIIGDVNQTDLKSIWHGQDINIIREMLKEGKKKLIPICANCYTQR